MADIEETLTVKQRPTVLAVYYPHWHRYDHGQAWKGEGWTEWEGLKAALPRFQGHAQPLKPTWGCFDESDPAWAAQEIDLAADHGVDVFLWDWYWYSGVRNMQEALEQGFLRAPNRERLSFCLMWANHDRVDQFCPEYGKPRNVWLPSRHSIADLERVIDYCAEHYFSQPNYWRVEGKLYLSIFQAERMVRELGGPQATRRIFTGIDRRLARAGLPPIWWSGMVGFVDEAKAAEALSAAGFSGTGSYVVGSAGPARPEGTVDYQEIMQAHVRQWGDLSRGSVPHLPVVTMGCDTTPRCRPDTPWPVPVAERAYPYVPVVVGNTPERFRQLCAAAGEHLAARPRHPNALLLYAWNEWTEGGYLLPEERTGNAYLEAVRAVFGLGEGKVGKLR